MTYLNVSVLNNVAETLVRIQLRFIHVNTQYIHIGNGDVMTDVNGTLNMHFMLLITAITTRYKNPC